MLQIDEDFEEVCETLQSHIFVMSMMDTWELSEYNKDDFRHNLYKLDNYDDSALTIEERSMKYKCKEMLELLHIC